MKKFIAIIVMIVITVINLQLHAEKSVTREGNTFKVEGKKGTSSSKETGLQVEIKGKTYKVYQGSKGGLYVLRTSKEGKEYKQYLKNISPELEAQVKKALGI